MKPHELFVIYKEGVPISGGVDGHNAYLTKNGANIAIGRMISSRRRWRSCNESAEELRKNYSVIRYVPEVL